MDRTEVIHRLKAVEPALRSHGVAALYLFGSFARGSARQDSDVDLFIDPDRGSRFGFDDFMDSFDTLKAALPRREIGFSTRDGIGKHVRADVEREAIRVF
jgi:predicted nucleotidyltransferase